MLAFGYSTCYWMLMFNYWIPLHPFFLRLFSGTLLSSPILHRLFLERFCPPLNFSFIQFMWPSTMKSLHDCKELYCLQFNGIPPTKLTPYECVMTMVAIFQDLGLQHCRFWIYLFTDSMEVLYIYFPNHILNDNIVFIKMRHIYLFTPQFGKALNKYIPFLHFYIYITLQGWIKCQILHQCHVYPLLKIWFNVTGLLTLILS